MHVKTNIEHNIIQVAVLAICPLLLVVQTTTQALFYMIATSICFLISSIVCFVFSKFMSRNVKIFITAILSTFIITIVNLLLSKIKLWNLESSDYHFFAVLTTICLCIDVYFIETKAVVPHYLPKVFMDCVWFSLILFIYSFVLEFLSLGTVFGKAIPHYFGNEFFGSLTFRLIWLGVLCIIVDALYRVYVRKNDKKKMTYQKYIKKIRDEKEFQYNELYRKRLLTSDVEIKKVAEEKLDEMNQKVSENLSPSIETKPVEEVEEEPAKEKKNKKGKIKKSKASKNAKVEKVFNPKKSEGDEK